MTTTTVPPIGSVWTDTANVWPEDTGLAYTITDHTTIDGKPNVKFTSGRPGSDAQGVGIADVDFFLHTHTEVIA